MRRVGICCIIMVILIGTSIMSVFIIGNNCISLKDTVSEIQILYKNDETAQALKKTEELNRSWNKRYKILSTLINQDKLYEINTSIAKIRPFIQDGNDEIDAEFQSILYNLEFIRSSEFPFLYNIF